MENLNNIAKLLGEENEKRLKDAVTDMLISRFQEDIDDYDEYMIDIYDLFNEIEDEIRTAIKEKYIKMYMAKADQKLAELFEKAFG